MLLVLLVLLPWPAEASELRICTTYAAIAELLRSEGEQPFFRYRPKGVEHFVAYWRNPDTGALTRVPLPRFPSETVCIFGSGDRVEIAP